MSSSTNSRGKMYNLCEQVEGGLGSVPKVFLFKPSYSLNVSFFHRKGSTRNDGNTSKFIFELVCFLCQGCSTTISNDTNNMNLQVE